MHNTIMQEQEKLREIESLGEEAEDFQEDAMWEESRMEAGSWGGILLVQAVICALIVLALIFFKVSDDGKYQEITHWYRHEMTNEIELPTFNRASPEPVESSEPTATPPPAESAPPQML